MHPSAPATGTAALATAYSGITAIVGELDDHGLLLPSGCRGWTLCDLLLHVNLDAQRALVAFATPGEGPPDVDSVSYWRAFPGVGDADAAIAHAQWVRRMASAYQRPTGIVRQWSETSAAAVRAATGADPGGRVATQDHVLTVPDFVATLVTEAVIHHLDLIAHLPGAPGPAPQPTAVAVATVRGLAAPHALPPHWGAREILLKCTGRADLDVADRRALGPLAQSFPLLG